MLVGALSAANADLHGSALRVIAAGSVVLVAPLFWPGLAATPQGSAGRIVGWSAAVAAAAALLVAFAGHALPPLLVCGMVLLIALTTHAASALLERLLRARAVAAPEARVLAAGSLVAALALLGSVPLWLGPGAELLSARWPWAIDAAIAASPLTHLPIASENDLLRNEWFYQRENLASLQFAYLQFDQTEYVGIESCQGSRKFGLLSVSFLNAVGAAAVRSTRRATSTRRVGGCGVNCQEVIEHIEAHTFVFPPTFATDGRALTDVTA